MAQFDAIHARDWPAERLIALESEINPERFARHAHRNRWRVNK